MSALGWFAAVALVAMLRWRLEEACSRSDHLVIDTGIIVIQAEPMDGEDWDGAWEITFHVRVIPATVVLGALWIFYTLSGSS